MESKSEGQTLSSAAQQTLDALTNVGVQGASCLTEEEINSLGDLTLNELKGLAKAQGYLGTASGGVCGGKIF